MRSLLLVAMLVFSSLFVVGMMLPTPPGSMSLASDVGLSEVDVCAAVEREGPTSIRHLEASGFPRATLDAQEVYRLTRDGQTEAVVLLDWQERQARCLPLAYEGVVAASLDMTPQAYNVLVAELRHVLETGHVSGEGRFGTLWTLYWGSDIRIPTNPDYADKYERLVLKWAIGSVRNTE